MAQSAPRPLWPDERIEAFANAKYDVSEYFEVVGAMTIIRDEYEAERATVYADLLRMEEIAKDNNKKLDELERELKRLLGIG